MLLAFFILPATAQKEVSELPIPEAPQISLSTSYGFSAYSGLSTGDTWTSSQSLGVEIFGRWAQGLTLQANLQADYSQTPLNADQILPLVFLTWNANSWMTATLGKQMLVWGTARVFSSLDRLEALPDPLKIKKIFPGLTGVKIEFIPNDWLSICLLGIPEYDLRDSRGALRADVLLGEWDLAAGILKYTSRPFMDFTTLSRDSLDKPAGFITASWFSEWFGFYGEMQLKGSRDRDWVLKSGLDNQTITWFASEQGINITGSAGVQISLSVWLNGTVTVLGEYHYQGDGFDSSEMDLLWKSWKTWKNSTTALFVPPSGLSLGYLRKHYGYLGFSGIPLTEKISLGFSLHTGPESGFYLGSTDLIWNLDPNLSLGMGYRRAGQWRDEATDPGDLFLLTWRDQVSLFLSGSF